MPHFETQQLFIKYRYHILFILTGLILIFFGIFLFKNNSAELVPESGIEVLGESDQSVSSKIITVEISGAVKNAGVYKMENGSRVDDLILKAGGFNGEENVEWIAKYLNRASKISDGQKVFIPLINQHSDSLSASNNTIYQNASDGNIPDSNKLININTANLDELDMLPGIGPVYGQNVIEHRPYSTIEELLSKDVIKQSLYDKIKNLVTVY